MREDENWNWNAVALCFAKWRMLFSEFPYLLVVWKVGDPGGSPNVRCYLQYRITKHNMNPYFLCTSKESYGQADVARPKKCGRRCRIDFRSTFWNFRRLQRRLRRANGCLRQQFESGGATGGHDASAPLKDSTAKAEGFWHKLVGEILLIQRIWQFVNILYKLSKWPSSILNTAGAQKLQARHLWYPKVASRACARLVSPLTYFSTHASKMCTVYFFFTITVLKMFS